MFKIKLTLISMLLIAGSIYGQNQKKIDSVFAVCRDNNIHDTIRASAYISLTSLYFNQKIDAIEIVCLEGIRFIKKAKLKNDPTTYKTLLKTESTLLINNGVAYYHLGKLDKAINVWYKARDLKEELGDKKGMTNVLNNIANIQIDLDELEKAKQNFKAILSIQEEIGDSNGIGRTYNSIGYIYRVQGKDSLALTYYKKALSIREQIDNKLGMASCYNNIGFIYKQNNQYDKAIIEYEKSRAIFLEFNDQIGELTTLNNLANCYFKLGNLPKAKQFATIGYKIATESNKEGELIHLAEILYRINKVNGNESDALKYYEEYIGIRDSLDSKKNYKALINQELEYDFKQKEKINELNRDKEKALEELAHKNELNLSNEKSFRLTLVLLLISAGLLIVIILFIRINRQRKLIQRQGLELEMVALRSQMNPHFLFNSLNSIKHFIIKNKTEDAANYISKFAKVIRLVLENSQHNLICLSEELTCLKYYIELEQLRFDNKFTFEIEGNINSEVIQLPPLILQPFIENAIWHGLLNKEGSDGLIKIRLSETDTAVTIMIEDNGVGREKAAKVKEFDGVKKESMGLNITHNRLKTLNNILGIQSSIQIIDLFDNNNKAIGTRVNLIIPFHE